MADIKDNGKLGCKACNNLIQHLYCTSTYVLYESSGMKQMLVINKDISL